MQMSCEVTSLRVCYVVLSVHCCLVATCWERDDLLALICDVFIEFLSLSHVVTWVRCGTRVYRFLIFVTFTYFVTSYCGLGRLKHPSELNSFVNPIVGVCNCSMFCCMLLYVHSSIAIILMRKSELVALLNLSPWCLVMVERLFLACHGVVCGLWLWYFLIILTYYLCASSTAESRAMIKMHLSPSLT